MPKNEPDNPGVDPSAASSPSHRPHKRRPWMVIALAAVVIVACAGAFVWQRARQDALEQEARAAIAALNGLPVLDANQKHVVSLNLQLIKDESAAKQAMQWVDGLPHLQILDASGTSVGDDDLAVVSSLRKLNSLHLNGTGVTDDGLRHITSLGRLQGLHLGGTAVTDKSLAEIARLKGLKHLDLSNTAVGPGLSQLAAMENLTWLLLRGIAMDPPVPAEIAKLTNIKRLTVSDPEVRSELQESLKEQLPNLSID